MGAPPLTCTVDTRDAPRGGEMLRLPQALRRAAPVVLVAGALVVYALGTFVVGSVAWEAAARGLSSSALASSPVASGKAP